MLAQPQEPVNLNAFRYAKALHGLALAVGKANSFDHYYRTAIEFEKQRIEKSRSIQKKSLYMSVRTRFFKMLPQFNQF